MAVHVTFQAFQVIKPSSAASEGTLVALITVCLVNVQLMPDHHALVRKHFPAGSAGNPQLRVSRQVFFIGPRTIEFFPTESAHTGVMIVHFKLVSGLLTLGGESQATEPTLYVCLSLRSLPGPDMSELVYLQAVIVLKTDPTDRTDNRAAGVGVALLVEVESLPGLVLFITKFTLKGNGGMSGLVFP